jgi:hypothetical protein
MSPPGGADRREPAPVQRNDLLDVDSGLLAVVDPAIVDSFLAVNASLVDGGEALEPSGFRAAGGGLLCATGGDGRFAFAASTQDGAVHGFEVLFDDIDATASPWTPVATIPVGSGTILVGDPGFLREFVPDPFTAPYEAHGAWAILAMPGAGTVVVSFVNAPGRIIGLRGAWRPS